MTATTAIHPLPALMSSAKTLTAPSESCAPARPDERPRDKNSDDPVADDVDAERARRFGLLADAAQPQPDRGQEQNDADHAPSAPRRPRSTADWRAKAQPSTGTPTSAGTVMRPSPTTPGSLKVPLTPNMTRSRYAVSPEASRFMPMPMTTGSPRKIVAP